MNISVEVIGMAACLAKKSVPITSVLGQEQESETRRELESLNPLESPLLFDLRMI